MAKRAICIMYIVSLSLLWVWVSLGSCETSQGLLSGVQAVFLGDLPFLPIIMIGLAQKE